MEIEKGKSFTVDDEEISRIGFNSEGLIPAIVQEHSSGKVLMMEWMNEESLRETLSSGRTWFWSRSRQEYWCKGEPSGDRQFVQAAFYDCDHDTLLFLVIPVGKGACHTGEFTCFFTPFGSNEN